MENLPQITRASGSATVTFNPPVRMVLVENLDATITINVAMNGDATGWDLIAASRKGNYLKGGCRTVVITPATGSPTWQVEGTMPCK